MDFAAFLAAFEDYAGELYGQIPGPRDFSYALSVLGFGEAARNEQYCNAKAAELAELAELKAAVAAAQEAVNTYVRDRKERELRQKKLAECWDAFQNQVKRIKKNDAAFAIEEDECLKKKWNDGDDILGATAAAEVDAVLGPMYAKDAAYRDIERRVQVQLENADSEAARKLPKDGRPGAMQRVPPNQETPGPLGTVDLTCPECGRTFRRRFKTIFDKTELVMGRHVFCPANDHGCSRNFGLDPRDFGHGATLDVLAEDYHQQRSRAGLLAQGTPAQPKWRVRFR